MLNKLKFLKSQFKRKIVPELGTIKGIVEYTEKNTIGNRRQFIFDLDANTTTIRLIGENTDDTDDTVISTYTVPYVALQEKEMYQLGFDGTYPTITSEDITLTLPYLEWHALIGKDPIINAEKLNKFTTNDPDNLTAVVTPVVTPKHIGITPAGVYIVAEGEVDPVDPVAGIYTFKVEAYNLKEPAVRNIKTVTIILEAQL